MFVSNTHKTFGQQYPQNIDRKSAENQEFLLYPAIDEAVCSQSIRNSHSAIHRQSVIGIEGMKVGINWLLKVQHSAFMSIPGGNKMRQELHHDKNRTLSPLTGGHRVIISRPASVHA